MTLVQLRHLIALAETQSFSRAAELSHLTQPALSRSIQSLESELGMALVDRVGRRAELTPLGRETLERARQLVFDAQELQERVQAAAQGESGQLRVGMGSGPAVMLSTALMLEVARHRPQWRVEVARGSTDLLVQRLRTRSLDALVIDLRSLVPAADLQVTRVCEVRGAFMVRRGHPLAAKSLIRFEDLAPYPLASIPLSAEVARMLVERYGPLAHPEKAVSVRCDDIDDLLQVAQSSDTVLLAIRASGPGLVELRMDPPMLIQARLGLVTLTRRTSPPTLSLLHELMTRLLVDPPEPIGRRRTSS